MLACPHCGKQRTNWPMILCVIAFYLLYAVWMLGDYQPRELRPYGLLALLIFSFGAIWSVLRAAQHRKQHAESSKALLAAQK